MMKLAMSAAASAMLRSLLDRAGVSRDRILLIEFRSVDWQSLTFVGERHCIRLRITGPDAEVALRKLATGLSDDEFAIPGQIVADMMVIGKPEPMPDGSIELGIEALTIAD